MSPEGAVLEAEDVAVFAPAPTLGTEAAVFEDDMGEEGAGFDDSVLAESDAALLAALPDDVEVESSFAAIALLALAGAAAFGPPSVLLSVVLAASVGPEAPVGRLPLLRAMSASLAKNATATTRSHAESIVRLLILMS